MRYLLFFFFLINQATAQTPRKELINGDTLILLNPLQFTKANLLYIKTVELNRKDSLNHVIIEECDSSKVELNKGLFFAVRQIGLKNEVIAEKDFQIREKDEYIASLKRNRTGKVILKYLEIAAAGYLGYRLGKANF